MSESPKAAVATSVRAVILVSALGVFSALGVLCLLSPPAMAFQWSKLNPMSYIQSSDQPAAAENLAQPKAKAPAKQHAQPKATSKKSEEQGAVIETEKGSIGLILYPKDAPLTVANFEKLVEKQFYNVP